MVCFNFPRLIWYKSIGKYCFITNHVNYFVMSQALFYAFVPIVFMCLSNTVIISKLMVIKYYGMSRSNESVSKSSTRASVMVVTVSLAFIILTFPLAVDSAIQHRFSSNPFGSIFVVSMQYLNHSINGILYCIFGKKFRNELGKIMLSCRRKRMQNSSISMASVNTNTSGCNTHLA